jgi:DNA/RNA endonuclease YhcR with UshA esterase domain
MKRWMSGWVVVLAGVAVVGLLRAQEVAPGAAAQAEAPVVPATETARLRELVGHKVTVEGKVGRIGTTQDGKITFFNFSSERNGFVTVVFERSYPGFTDGLKGYANKRVRVTGIVQRFREDTPQIVLERPEDIKVIEEAAVATPTPTPQATATPAAER